MNKYFPSVGNISKTPLMAMDSSAETSEGLEGNLGDDDGETWSQSDDPYLQLGPQGVVC